MIDNADNLGVPRVIKPSHVISNNKKANTLFVSQLFNTNHGLIPEPDQVLEPYSPPEDEEGTEEEKQFRVWLNSMDLPDQDIITNLYDDIQDGILLCKVVDKMQPGAIDWKKVQNPARHQFDKNGNCSEGIRAITDKNTGPGLKLIAVGGQALAQGKPIDTLASIWCLCKESYKRLTNGKDEKQIVEWANSLVAGKDEDG